MGEKQEKVWVVMKARGNSYDAKPVKVFDDRSDAREYVKQLSARRTIHAYWVEGVKKG